MERWGCLGCCRWRILVVLGTLAVLGACAQIPVAELTQYRESFAKTTEASEPVLIDFDQALRQQRERQIRLTQPQPKTQQPFPTTFSGFGTSDANVALDPIEVQRVAFRVIGRYNDVLAQLAEGKSDEAVGNGAAALVSSLATLATTVVGSAFPEAGAVAGAAKTLATALERARRRAEFASALKDNRELLSKIFDLLSKYVDDHYRVRALLANESIQLLVNDMRDQARIIRQLFQTTAAPPREIAGLVNIEVELNAYLGVVQPPFEGFPIKLGPAPSGAPAYTAAMHGIVKQLLAGIGQASAKYQATIDQMQSLGRILLRYRSLLANTKSALDTLINALDQPQNLADTTEELLKLTFDLKRDFESFTAALSATRR